MPVKNFEHLISAVVVLRERGRDIRLRIAGDAPVDDGYFQSVRDHARQAGVDDIVTFLGSVPHEEIVEEYRRAGVFINASTTGSLDKTEIEAMACGTPTVSSNDSYGTMVTESHLDELCLTFAEGDVEAIAARVERINDMEEREYEELCRNCRTVAEDRHDVETLMRDLARQLRDVRDQRK